MSDPMTDTTPHDSQEFLRTETHKFGGASVKDADAIRRVGSLLTQTLLPGTAAVVVVSAMGKTTNALEAVWRATSEDRPALWDSLRNEHIEVAQTLGLSDATTGRLVEVFEAAWEEATSVDEGRLDAANAAYDAFVAAGEMASTVLVHAWLESLGLDSMWWDVRHTLQTVGPHKAARVEESNLMQAGSSLRRALRQLGSRGASGAGPVIVTQGFVGRDQTGATTTLGREGSDYSAALLTVASASEGLTIWKDVPGMMNADPKRHSDAVTIPRVDHAEAVELSYYGASVIHPRTIKPLRQAAKPLWVKSFVHPEGPGTHIDSFPGLVPDVPMFIWREDQVWIEVSTLDGSFLAEDHLSTLFDALGRAGIHVRLMQQSATHFGLLTDRDDVRLTLLQTQVHHALGMRVRHDLSLLTIRHGHADVMDTLTEGREVVVEQRAGATWRRVLGSCGT
ncbi:MAG: aspartate kinase [Bacteroidetes bacterium]|nr:aspartate kinase [Bacteroidota bacterium]MDA0903406.1 aspartate kinase [Bacteroidota bacterium]MDA1241562.1 aspartate kinase [Bacteroidota bacterium]